MNEGYSTRSSAPEQEAPDGFGPHPPTPRRGPTAAAERASERRAAVGNMQRHPIRRPADRALRIGGFTPMTTVDYPGQLAAVVFCQGCPWRCRYCHNGHLLPARCDRPIPWTEVQALLRRRRGLLDAIVFSGGEPTLQTALPTAMKAIKAMGFKIGLHTAGSYPDRLRRLLPHLDWVGLDIKALPGDYMAVTGTPGSGKRAWESLELLIDAGLALEVRTTLMPGWNTADHIGGLMGALSDAGVDNYVVQGCRTANMFDPSTGSGDANQGLTPSLAKMGAAGFRRFSIR